MGCANSVPVKEDEDLRKKSEARVRASSDGSSSSDESKLKLEDPRLYSIDKLLPSFDKQYENPEAAQAETIIMFDWDDVLCPSSWANHHGVLGSDGLAKGNSHYGLRTLSSRVADLLTNAQALGKVFVVTHAPRPWVDMSCEMLMPELAPLLEWIPVIYANELLADSPADMQMSWDADAVELLTQASSARSAISTEAKVRSVQVALSSMTSRGEGKSWKNIVYIGNGSFEHEDIRQVWRSVPPSGEDVKPNRTKTVKLMDVPNLKGVRLQLNLASRVLSRIVHVDDDVDVDFNTVVGTANLTLNGEGDGHYYFSGSSAPGVARI